MKNKKQTMAKLTTALTLGVLACQGPYALAQSATEELQENWYVLEEYCMGCHNFDDYAGGIDFSFASADLVGEDAEIFELALKKLRTSVMPPPSQEQPSIEERWNLIASLENALDDHALHEPDPSRIVMRRLNRTQYVNSIFDMTGVRLDEGLALPTDDKSDGFDNIAGVIKMSPAFLDQYITSGRAVAEEAVGTDNPRAVATFLPASSSHQGGHVHGLPLGTRGGNVVQFTAPVDGEYMLTIPNMAGAGYVLGMEYEHRVFITVDGEKVFDDTIGGGEDFRRLDQEQAPAVADINGRFADIKVQLSSGEHSIGFGFFARSFTEGDEFLGSTSGNRGMSRIAQMRGIEVFGPLNTTGHMDTHARNKVMVCEPTQVSEEEACAREIFASLATQAFRRSITEEDLVHSMRFYEQGRELGSFDDGIKYGLTAIFTNPKFLFRTEALPVDASPGQIVAISDLELASRLSFFLWSSAPDAELVALAESGELSQERELERQVDRMLADPRSEALVDNFISLWLRLHDLDDIDPDTEIFPEYTDSLLPAFKEEIRLFALNIFEQDRPVHELITADYTYLNEDLALHYGITDVKGDYFREVRLDQEERFGLLGKGGVQMVTSYANRTTPVIRGAYIMEKFQGVPSAAPPQNVPAFPETEEGQAVALTVRERLATHRDNPACAGCHDVMDPLGLALENFNAVGRFRLRDSDAGNVLIDTSASLPDGTPLEGINDLRESLVARPDQFAQTFTESLMTYALGRGVEAHDMPAVRAIVDQAERGDYSIVQIIKGIIYSDQFRLMTIPEAELNEIGSL